MLIGKIAKSILILSKAAPGEEPEEFRGGDPEELQEKKEAKQKEQAESGEAEEIEEKKKEEEENFDPDEAAVAAEEEAEKETEKSIMPLSHGEVSPVDEGDYRRRNINGDPISNLPRLKHIDQPVRSEEDRKKMSYSDFLGAKIPLTGANWVYLRRFTIMGKDEEAEKERDKLWRAFNRGNLFDPQVFAESLNKSSLLSKAIKGEVIPGHKYVYRYWDGKWNYKYTGGVDPQHHGIHYSWSRAGSTTEVPEGWVDQNDPDVNNPEAAFQAAHGKLGEIGGTYRVSINDPDTGTPVNKVLVFKPHKVDKKTGEKAPPAKSIEIHTDKGNDEKYLSSKAEKRISNLEALTKYMDKQHASLARDMENNPWLEWRYTGAAAKGGKTFVYRFRKESQFYQEPSEAIKKERAGWRQFTGSQEDFDKFLESHRAEQAAILGMAPKTPFKKEEGRPVTNMIQAGGLKKEYEFRPYVSPEGKVDQSRQKKKALVTKWGSAEERTNVIAALVGENGEHRGAITLSAARIVAQYNARRIDSGMTPLNRDEKSGLMEKLIQAGIVATFGAVDSYAPGRGVKLVTHIYNRAYGEQWQALSSALDAIGQGYSTGNAPLNAAFSHIASSDTIEKDILSKLTISKAMINDWSKDAEASLETHPFKKQALKELKQVVSSGDEASVYDWIHKWNSVKVGGDGSIPPLEPKELDDASKLLFRHIGKRANIDVSALEFDPGSEMDQIVKDNNVKTTGDLFRVVSVTPPQTDEGKEEWDNARQWIVESPEAAHLTKAQQQEEQQQEQPSVNYLGRKGAPGAYNYQYQVGDDSGNVVHGTNAPEGHPDHDELLGSPTIHSNEPTMEDSPQMFSEDGKKLSQAVPPDAEVEDNPTYDPNPESGNQWAKRYRDQNGDMRYVYYHKDIALDPKLEHNTALRHVDVQLPKIRSWYKNMLMSKDKHSRIVGLFVALVDQGKISPKTLSSLKVGDVLVSSGGTYQIQHGGSFKVLLSLDHRMEAILKDLAEGKKHGDQLFAVGGSPINVNTVRKVMHDKFGVSTHHMRVHQTTEAFSKEFQKLLKESSKDNIHVDDLTSRAMHNTAGHLGFQDGADEIKHHVDPIALEAMQIGTMFKRKEMEKGYKLHGKMEFMGLPISIENAKGSVRKWYDPNEKRHGETKMHYDYGYIRRTMGVDGDHVDCYIGPDKKSQKVYVVHQKKAPNFEKFDEDKCMLGFSSAADAKEAYLKQYDSPKFFGGMSSMSMDDFKQKVFATKEAPKMIKAAIRQLRSDIPDKSEEEELFGQWVHSYPIHEHRLHWAAYQRKMNEPKLNFPGAGATVPPKPDANAHVWEGISHA